MKNSGSNASNYQRVNSNMNSPAELDATYHGFVGSTYDALILVEACISGQIKHVSRRPQDREREYVIQSGRIFIYEETTSGIKRWTDGISWSPSRILGNFLIYRQLVKAFGPGEKKKAIKRPKVAPSGNAKTNPNNSNGQQKENLPPNSTPQVASISSYGRAGTLDAETERTLIGSLTDSYDFLEDGLVKKTISVTCEGATHHLVSYYTVADVVSQKFLVPSKNPRFLHTQPRPSLMTSQNYRSPIEDLEHLDRPLYPHDEYDSTSQGVVETPGPVMVNQGTFPNRYGTAIGSYHASYSMPLVAAAYRSNFPTYTNTTSMTYPNHYISASGVYQPAQHPVQYSPNYRAYYVSSGSSVCDGHHAMISANSHAQQPSIFHPRDSEDSEVSMSMDDSNKDHEYIGGQNGYYGASRRSSLNAMAWEAAKALPNSSKLRSSRQTPPLDKVDVELDSYRVVISTDNKDVWQTGNACVGHGHYQQV